MCIIGNTNEFAREQNNDFQFLKLSVSLFTSVLNGANHLLWLFEQNVDKMVRCRY